MVLKPVLYGATKSSYASPVWPLLYIYAASHDSLSLLLSIALFQAGTWPVSAGCTHIVLCDAHPQGTEYIRHIFLCRPRAFLKILRFLSFKSAY
jgi:hypothetical protein